MRKRVTVLMLILALMTVSITPLAARGNPTDASTAWQLARVRLATARYHDARVAIAAGYLPTEECVALPGVGGMGYHYVNPEYFERAFVTQQVDIERPPALLYERRGGWLQLVGVEYFFPVVLASGETWWGHDVPEGELAPAPTLFGQRMDGPMPGHTPEMPAHYDLHVWVWKSNPAGMFAMWNPNVSCPDGH